MALNKIHIYLILAGLCFLAYANSLNGAFVSDDITSIAQNPQISSFWRYWLDPPSALHSINYLLAGENTFVYHLTNLLLHSLNTILAFFFLSLFFGRKAGFLAACVFAVHPIHSEAVSWISGRPYLIISLALFIVYLLYYHSAYPPAGFNLRRYLLCLFIYAYFVATNFSFLPLLPLFLILSDFTFNRWRENWKLWLPFLCLAALRVILAIHLIPGRIDLTQKEMGDSAAWNNPVFNMAYSLSTNFFLTLWPAKLSLYHDPAVVSGFTLKAQLVILVLVALSLPFLFKKAKEIFFGAGIFILFLAPTYSPIPLASPVAERYLYFPSIAISMFVAFFYTKCRDRGPVLARASNILLVLLIAALLARTWARNLDWKTPGRLWKATAAVAYNSGRAHNNLGESYYREGNIEGAIREFKQAVGLNPNSAKANNNLASVYEDTGRRKEAEDLFKKAIEIDPRYAAAYYNLGNLYNNTAKQEQAIGMYKKAIEIDPHYAGAYHNLGVIFVKSGRRKEAEDLFKKAIEIKPDYGTAYANLSNLYNSSGKAEEAVEVYKKAIKTNPRSIDYYVNLGALYINAGRLEEAIDMYKKALNLNPSYLPAYNNLGIIYKRKGLFAQAVQAYKKALAIEELAPVHNNLGNLYRLMNMPQEAEAEFKRALSIDPGLKAAEEGLRQLGAGAKKSQDEAK